MMDFLSRSHRWVRGLLALAAFCTAPCAQAAPTLSVSVLPRIGLFHEAQYVRTNKWDLPTPLIQASFRDSWTPMSRRGFLEAIARTPLADVIGGTIQDKWEILTTYDPARNYERRTVRIALADAGGPKVVSCRVFVDGLTTIANGADGACRLEFDLFDNGARTIDVSYRLKGVEETGRMQARVAEDFLLVIAGDSYASGEGNPDRACGGRSLLSCGTPALWMDEECHRSFWSAGMRTAMRMIREDREHRNGAYTVVNVACSGAGMAEGVVQGYGGVVALRDAVKRHQQTLHLDPRGMVVTGRKITPQLEVLEELVARRGGHRGIDLLIMSAGGNDLQFGAVVVDSIFGEHTLEWAQQTEENLRARMRSYTHAFLEFSRRLKAMPVTQVVWVPYPNITGTGADGEALAECASGPVGSLSRFTSLGFSPAERTLAHRALVVRLNGENEAYAGRERYVMVNRTDVDGIYDGRGWCAADASNRLVRKADESVQRQGGLHGAMHPTDVAHERVAELIYRLLAPTASAATR